MLVWLLESVFKLHTYFAWWKSYCTSMVLEMEL